MIELVKCMSEEKRMGAWEEGERLVVHGGYDGSMISQAHLAIAWRIDD